MEDRIRVEGIVKTFGHTIANKNVNLAIAPGSVHGLAGENGSGKSTLASIICGMQKPDTGKIYKDGQLFEPKNPVDANDHKVSMVVQELGIIGMLPPVINMFLGKTDSFSKGGIVDIKAMTKTATETFEKWGLPRIPLGGVTAALSIEERKILELARALVCDPDFLILDEISQALSQDNRDILYKFIKKFSGEGRSILMITHDLEEMMEVCDTISVLRDGEVIDHRPANDFTMAELQKEMIGREVSGDYYRDDEKEDYLPEVILKAENLSCGDKIQNVNFELHKGEILAFCGLSDAGIHDVGRVMFGIERGTTGTVTYVPEGKQLHSPGDMLATGGAYLSKDRDAEGLMLQASIAQNLIVPNAKRLSGKMAYLSPSKTRKLAQEASDSFEIKSESINSLVGSLSGGNKQKVNLSRWLVQDLKYVILDCPTRGVDVGVKAYIYGVLKKAKKEGVAIIMITDELPEALGMADRIIVMRDHVQAGSLGRSEGFSAEKLGKVML